MVNLEENMNKGSFWKTLLFSVAAGLILWQCAGTGGSKVMHLDNDVPSRNIRIDSTVTADPAMEAFIAPYRDTLTAKMGVVVGHAAVNLTKDRLEGTLNNWVSDLMLETANRLGSDTVYTALTNRGGLRVDIPKGPITLEKIYELMPFENELVVLKLTGKQMETLGQQIGDAHGECIAGMRLVFKDNTLQEMTIQGKPVEPDKIYPLVTTDYLSSPGRDKMSILGEVPRQFVGIRLRDAILQEVEAKEAAGQAVTATVDHRIVFK